MDPQISGVKVTSVGKRDSLLARAEELKGRGTVSATKPVSVSMIHIEYIYLYCNAVA